MANFSPIFDTTLAVEGGFQNQPQDKGNYCGGKLVGTKYGIAAAGAYQDSLGRCPTENEVRNLTKNDAYKIAKRYYWDKVKGDDIKNQALAHVVFDSLYGSCYGLRDVRRAINEVAKSQVVNGNSFNCSLSNSEVQELNRLDPKKLIDSIKKFRFSRLSSLSNWDTYGAGWVNRWNEIVGQYSFKDITKSAKTYAKKNVLLTILIGVLLVLLVLFIAYRKPILNKLNIS